MLAIIINVKIAKTNTVFLLFIEVFIGIVTFFIVVIALDLVQIDVNFLVLL